MHPCLFSKLLLVRSFNLGGQRQKGREEELPINFRVRHQENSFAIRTRVCVCVCFALPRLINISGLSSDADALFSCGIMFARRWPCVI